MDDDDPGILLSWLVLHLVYADSDILMYAGESDSEAALIDVRESQFLDSSLVHFYRSVSVLLSCLFLLVYFLYP